MPRVVFDQLNYLRKLQARGMSEQQAHGQAEALSEAFASLADTLVTKDQLEAALADIRSTQRLHSWMLGILIATELVPLLGGSLS
jgi:hypothetical protein